MIFRFDDVSINTDIKKLRTMAEAVWSVERSARVIYAVSLFCSDMALETGKQREFVFKPIWKAYSDHRKFFNVTEFGVPEICSDIEIASHGLIHIDHRLMHRDAQELSIITSCSILRAKTFIPPFNKWNADTESICKEHGINLMKFEDGWLGAEYNQFNKKHQKWYAHGFNWTAEKFRDWISS